MNCLVRQFCLFTEISSIDNNKQKPSLLIHIWVPIQARVGIKPYGYHWIILTQSPNVSYYCQIFISADGRYESIGDSDGPVYPSMTPIVILESLKSSISHVQNIYNFIEFLQNLNMTTKSFLGPLWINRINHGVKKDIYFVFMNSYYLSLELQFLQSITLIAIFMISLHNTWFEQCF